MNFTEYANHFESILNSDAPPEPYNDPQYIEYTKLNHQRMNRWLKTLELDQELVLLLQNLQQPLHWIIIIEPWCGDVAPTLPFLVKLAELSDAVTYELQLRDSEPFLINHYLTRCTKSIPKFIVRNKEGQDLFTWGARPTAAQQLMDEMKAANTDMNTLRTNLQNWYNEDKGRSLQQELKELIRDIS